MNRFDRITAILIHLQSRRVVQARDLSERFDVSLRTIYRDIRTLEGAGVPILGEAGVGYSIMEGYRLPPVMFTPDEAGSFVAAEKLMEKFTDRTLGAHFQSAMYKVKSVLKNSEKDIISNLESHIQINPTHAPFNKELPDALDILLKSISEKKIVRIKYKAQISENSTERSIEPVGIFHENQYWYVMAFCHLRNDYRQFRADRMMGITSTTTPFTRKHGHLDEYRKKDKNKSKETIKVIMLVDKTLHPFIQGRKQYYGFLSERAVGDEIEMTFLTTDILNAFPRWYLMFADHAKIIAPQELKDNIKSLLDRIQVNL